MDNTILPQWMIYAGSSAGLIWAILQIAGWITKLTHIPKLEVRLTKEVFFRLIEDGETIFTNAVFIARHGPIEIKNIKFTLNRTSGSKKTFTFAPKNIGNKVPNPPNPYASNNFWSKSCKTYLVENVPTHILFLSSLEEYSGSFRKVADGFTSKVIDYQNELQGKLKEIQSNEDKYLQEINTKLSGIESDVGANLLKFVQLEPGDYELTADVEYSRISLKFFRKEAEASSKISFSVDDSFLGRYKNQLTRFLEATSRNILFNRDNHFTYPEYQPDNIRET